jgi:hypothetical protein
LREAFAEVVVRPGDEFCFFASDTAGAATSRPAELAARFDRLGLAPEALKYGFELTEFPPERTRWAAELLEEARADAPLNTDARPVVFTLFLAVQRHYAVRPGAPRTLDDSPDLLARVREKGWVWVLAPFAAVLVLLAALRVGLGRRLAAPAGCTFAVVTTGMFGLAAEMLVVYGYQVAFGYVYRDIAMTVGLFMGGLALGGWASGRFARRAPVRALMAMEVLQGMLILAMPAAMSALSFSPYAFLGLAATAGLVTGAAFPLAARASLAHAADAGAVAGILEAADHLGAVLGAVCVGLLLVPAVGLAGAAVALASIKAVSLLGLVLASSGTAAGRGGSQVA